MSDITKMQTDIALLKNDFHNIEGLFDRLDTTIEKLTEVSTAVNKILAVHENRLDFQEEKDRELTRIVQEHDERIDEMYLKFTDKVDKSLNEIKAFQSEHHNQVTTKIDSVSTRVDRIEQYRYVIVGVVLAASIFSKELGALINLF